MGELLRLAESDFSKVFQDMINVANMAKIGRFGKCIWVNHLTFSMFGYVLLFGLNSFIYVLIFKVIKATVFLADIQDFEVM